MSKTREGQKDLVDCLTTLKLVSDSEVGQHQVLATFDRTLETIMISFEWRWPLSFGSDKLDQKKNFIPVKAANPSRDFVLFKTGKSFHPTEICKDYFSANFFERRKSSLFLIRNDLRQKVGCQQVISKLVVRSVVKR